MGRKVGNYIDPASDNERPVFENIGIPQVGIIKEIVWLGDFNDKGNISPRVCVGIELTAEKCIDKETGEERRSVINKLMVATLARGNLKGLWELVSAAFQTEWDPNTDVDLDELIGKPVITTLVELPRTGNFPTPYVVPSNFQPILPNDTTEYSLESGGICFDISDALEGGRFIIPDEVSRYARNKIFASEGYKAFLEQTGGRDIDNPYGPGKAGFRTGNASGYGAKPRRVVSAAAVEVEEENPDITDRLESIMSRTRGKPDKKPGEAGAVTSPVENVSSTQENTPVSEPPVVTENKAKSVPMVSSEPKVPSIATNEVDSGSSTQNVTVEKAKGQVDSVDEVQASGTIPPPAVESFLEKMLTSIEKKYQAKTVSGELDPFAVTLAEYQEQQLAKLNLGD
jgi:hypothetical protein